MLPWSAATPYADLARREANRAGVKLDVEARTQPIKHDTAQSLELYVRGAQCV